MQIRLDGLSKSYRRVPALRDVSLEIAPGQVVAVLGLNGAGKTTLLRAMAGIVAPVKGTIQYDGEVFHRDRLDLRRRLFFLPDFPPMFPNMSIAGHIAMCLRLYGRDGEQATPVSALGERTVTLLKELDLLPLTGVPIGTLSRGQMYKAALTALLAVDADLWLLDEPFASGMDPQGISAFKTRARDAAERGRTVIYSTQILDIVEKFSDLVCVLEHGELRAFESIAGLRQQTAAGDGVLEELFRRLREERS